MAVTPNWLRYLESIALELTEQSNRVRDLIGDSHWLSDGHHKEYLLAGLLSRYVPSGMRVARGFVVHPRDPELRSSEQDILVVDTNTDAAVFDQGQLVISFPRQVRACISVKTTLSKETVLDSIKGLNSVRQVCADDGVAADIWCGAYFFEVNETTDNTPTKLYEYVEEGLRQHPIESCQHRGHPVPSGPDMYCSSKSLAYKMTHAYRSDPSIVEKSYVAGYRCTNLATAFFLADLLDHLSVTRGADVGDLARFVENAPCESLGVPKHLLDL